MISPRVVPDDCISVLSLVGFGVPGSNFNPQLRMNAKCVVCFGATICISQGDTERCESEMFFSCPLLRRCVPSIFNRRMFYSVFSPFCVIFPPNDVAFIQPMINSGVYFRAFWFPLPKDQPHYRNRKIRNRSAASKGFQAPSKSSGATNQWIQQKRPWCTFQTGQNMITLHGRRPTCKSVSCCVMG